MPKIKDLNPDRIGDLGGTDLLMPFRMPDGNIGFGGGDTFGGDRPRVGGPNWRSPVVMVSDSHDVTKPIRFTRAMRGGQQIIDYAHNNPEFSTVLPCDFITIGKRMFVWLMFTAGLGNERYCKIAWSDDLGERWTLDPHRWSTSEFGGKRTMITWERGTDGFVYIASTGGLARNKNMLQWRVPEERILNPGFWEPWGYANGKWGWGNPPSDVLPAGTKLGEIGLRRIQGNWVLSGFDAGAYNIFVKVGASPTSDWHKAPDYRPVKGNSVSRGGPDVAAQLYGGYVHPDSTFDPPNLGLIVSQWNTINDPLRGLVAGEPYRGMQFLVTGIKPVVPPTNDAPPATTPVFETPGEVPGSQKDWNMATAEEVNAVVKGAAEPGKDYDNGREDGHNDGKRTLFGLVQRATWELTLWLKEIGTAAELEGAKTKKATMLGHVVRASSWGRINNAEIKDLRAGVLDCQTKLDKLLEAQKGK